MFTEQEPEPRNPYGASTSPIAIYSTLVLSAAGWLTLPWMWFYPKPFLLVFAVALLLPVLTVILCATDGPVFDLGMLRSSKGGTVGAAFFFPSLALAAGASKDLHLVDWKEVVVIAVVGGVLLGLLVYLLTPRSKREFLGGAGAMLVMAGYVYGATVIVNKHWDSVPAMVARVDVMRTRVSKGLQEGYYLRLAPWGLRTRSEEVKVEYDFFSQVAKGSTVCVHQHDGALRFRWYEVARCDAT